VDHLLSARVGAVGGGLHSWLLDPRPQRIGVAMDEPNQLCIVFGGPVTVDVEAEGFALLHRPLVGVCSEAHPVARGAHTGPQLSAPGRL